jgi:hypothetical protein
MCPTAVYGVVPGQHDQCLSLRCTDNPVSRHSAEALIIHDIRIPGHQVARGNMLESAGRADGSSPRPIQRFAWVYLLARFGYGA